MEEARILIVEDESIIAHGLRKALRNLGYVVPAIVSSGEEAVKKAAELRPHLVLMDIVLKGDMDGIEAAEQIRDRFDIPVIFITAYADDEILRRARVTEPFGYILKPFEERELHINIQIALYKHEAEKKSRASEKRYQAVVQDQTELICRFRPDGTLTFVNAAYCRYFDRQPDELIGRRFWPHIPEQDQHIPRQNLASLSREHPVATCEHRVIVREGQIRWQRWTNRAIFDQQGQVVEFQAVGRDITERKRTEEALRRYAGEQAALYAVTSAAATSLEPDELLSTVLDVVLPVLNSDAGWVTLPGPTLDDPPHIAAWRGVPDEFLAAETALPLRDCPVCAPLLAGSEVQTEPMLRAECPRLPSEVLDKAGLHSHVGIPLTSASSVEPAAGGRVLGILNVGWGTSRPYSEADRALLTAIGQHVGLALQNAQLYQATRQVDRLRALNELDRALAATLHPETVVEIALRQTAAAVDAPMGALFILPPRKERQADVYPEQICTLNQGWIEATISEEYMQHLRAFRRRLLESREPIPLPGDELATLIGGEYRSLAETWGPHGLVIPISSDKVLTAVLALGGRPADRPFTDEDLALARAAANRASQAIQNARLFEQTQQEITERVRLENQLAAIYRLGRELTLLRDEDGILRRMLETATDVLQFEALGYALVDIREPQTLASSVEPSNDEQAGELAYQQRIINGALEPFELRLPLDGERGIGVAVVRSGQTINVPDTTQDPRYAFIPGDRPSRSELCVPIKVKTKVGEQVIGVLNAEDAEPDHFTLADEQLLQTLADQTAVALENARLYRASEERAARLATLNAISAAAVSSLERDVVLRQILEMTCRALDATEGSILLSEPDTGELVFTLTPAGGTSGLSGQRIAPGRGIAGWVTQHDQAVRVNDVRQDPRFYNGMDKVIEFETRSLLCAPLKYHGEVTGVIEIVNKRDGAFTDEDLSLLEAVSSIAAVALNNAHLYTSLRSYADRLVTLNHIGLALTSTLDFSTVVHSALSHVQRLFLAQNVSLLQPDPQTGELHFVQALAGTTPVDIPLPLQPGESIAGWALEHGQPVLVEDVQADPRWSGRADQYMSSPTRALMAIPLTTPKRTIGVIEVTSSEPGAYDRAELNTLQAIASTLAVALENAGLYDELKTLLREREQAQAQLIHAEKMAALGRLTASIAHEINNPLQSMQGCLTLVEEELGGDRRQEKLDRYLGIAGSEIERIAVIVRRMRDFYRPVREGRQPTDLHGVLESVLALTNKQLQHSDVRVEREWAEDLPKTQANPDHLKQVFLNLVLNGIDAMPEGGTLHVRTALELENENEKPGFDVSSAERFSEKTRFLRVEFGDTGKGMPPEVLSHLFEPFFTTKEYGSGLGLSISYGIIQAHSGKITVESQVGVGTTFTILLPVA